MLLHKNVKLQRKVGRMAAMACVAMLLHGCGGGCSRSENGDVTGQPGVSPGATHADRENPSEILSVPVKFDIQSIEEALNTVQLDRELTSAETATVIVVAESSVNHLNQILDGLVRNEDAADTWHIFRELAAAEWPSQTVTIIESLGARPLDAYEQQRVYDLEKALAHNRVLIRQLRDNDSKLPSLLEQTP